MSQGEESERVDGRTARRLKTERRLIAAVGEVMQARGVEGLGVNAIAQQAGVTKVLIYRYFGGLEGLVKAYAESADFWPTLDEVLGPEREVLADPDRARAVRTLMERYAAALRARPLTLDLLAWECVKRVPLVELLEDAREAYSTALYQEFERAGFVHNRDVMVLGTLISAAIHYFAMRSRHIRIFGGVDIRSDEGWAVMMDAVEASMRALLAQSEGEDQRSAQQRKPVE